MKKLNKYFIMGKTIILVMFGLLGFILDSYFNFPFPSYTAAVLLTVLFPIGFFYISLYREQKIEQVTDSTTHNLIEKALVKSEERFRLMADNSIDCIWTIDKKLRFTYLSPSALEKMMGVKVNDWVGTKLRSHFSKKEFFKVGTLAVKALKKYMTNSEFDYTVFETKMYDGKHNEIDIEVSSKTFLDRNGKLIGLQGVTRDITERKQAEKELAKHREHLEELVKKRTKELEEKNKELERFNNLFVNREFRIKELKNKVKKLEKK